MVRSWRVLVWWGVVLAVLALSAAAAAQEKGAPGVSVPAPLAPWVPWVLHGKEEALCPVIQGGASTCAWPTRVELALAERGGSFTQRWRLDGARGSAPLPGDGRRWPLDVKVDGKPAIVLARSGKPVVDLAPGEHEVTGRFSWDSLPESILVPPESGLVALTLRGEPVPFPQRDAQGNVWLKKGGDAQEGDALEIVVHRRIEDEVPMRMLTRVQLAISGKSREVLLGRALPPGFVPVAIEAQIPARVEADGKLRIQARPGSFVIELTARSEGPVGALKRHAPEGPWREGDEVWSFAAHHELRVVEVTGVPAIDPQQTSVPEAWRSLPAFPVKVGDTLSFQETRRGDADPPPDRLTLARTWWLDFDGAGASWSDRLGGSLHRSQRLEMAPPVVLGRVAIRGKDQFITQIPGAKRSGVEVRQRDLDVVAEGRFSGDPSTLPAVGWDHDFTSVSATLNLPPGFRLLHASGVDEVPGTWLGRWRLLEIFLALVLSLTVARLFAPGWGALALLTLALTLPEPDAPRWIWVFVLAFEALTRVVPQGTLLRVVRVARGGALVILALITVPFLIDHVRGGLYPALTQSNGSGYIDTPTPMRGTFMASKSEDAPAPEPAAPPAPQLLQAADKEVDVDGDEGQEQSGKADQKAKPKKAEGRYAADLLPASKVAPQRQASQLNIDTYDPNAMVQTGPGLPSWRWTSVDLRWSGPVDRGQTLRLFLLGPAENMGLALLRAALLVALVLRLLPVGPLARRSQGSSGPGGPTLAALAALVLALLSPGSAGAQLPDKELLGELQRRLLTLPSCMPDCASMSRMALDARGDQLRLRASIEAGARIAAPLPGSPAQWLPQRVEVDGKAATALLLRDGKLYLALDPGSHDVVLEGPLPSRETVQIALPLRPRQLTATTAGWKLEGLHEDGLADESLQLTRGGGAQAALDAGVLPPFVRVERTLRIGLAWQVETRVVRASPPGVAVVLEIPTLPGESVTTADVRAAGGKVQVNLAPQASETSWSSVLESKSPVVLAAPKGVPWVEVWRLDLSPIWHASFEGIPQVHPGAQRSAAMPEWRPWPGETVAIAIQRPDGVSGQTLTIDRSSLEVRPGLRSTDATLELSLRSSRGGQHSIELPPGATLESLKIGGVAQPIRQEGSRVAVPVVPGAQQLQLSFREPRGIATRFEVAPVNLGIASVNAATVLSVSDARWILWTNGPRLGPAVLFWGMLLVLVILAAVLGRLKFTPLGVGSWFLLFLGLSQVDVASAAFVVGWLLMLGWRERRPELPRISFNLRQLALALATLIALIVLLVAVYHGLLDHPDMQIAGNSSDARTLRWFQDRTGAALPRPWIFSVPLLAYRLAMLGWALWLALAVLRWLRWGWAAFSLEGLWRRPEVRQPVSPPAAAPPAAPGNPSSAEPVASPPASQEGGERLPGPPGERSRGCGAGGAEVRATGAGSRYPPGSWTGWCGARRRRDRGCSCRTSRARGRRRSGRG